MTYLETLIDQQTPLEEYEVNDLKNWLQVLKDDCTVFGETPEDTARMNKIRGKISGWENHGKKR